MASSQPFRGIIGIESAFEKWDVCGTYHQRQRRRVATGTGDLVRVGIMSTISGVIRSSGTCLRSKITT
jgi:hypothetical protein